MRCRCCYAFPGTLAIIIAVQIVVDKELLRVQFNSRNSTFIIKEYNKKKGRKVLRCLCHLIIVIY